MATSINEAELVTEIMQHIKAAFESRGLELAYQRNIDVPRTIREIVFYTMRANGYTIQAQEGRRA